MNTSDLVRRHLRFGWWCLAVFLSLGIALEALHALKAGFYLDVTNSTRRLMWTLAHAHGTLVALMNIAFALTVSVLDRESRAASASGASGDDGGGAGSPRDVAGRFRLASRCLLAGGLLLPAGFLLGGMWFYDGDPGLGVLLVPIGALVLLVGVVVIARRT